MQPALTLFTKHLPRRPYCTNDPRDGQTVRGRDEALSFRLIQPNTSGKVLWIAFDLDYGDGATAWDRLSAPPPTLAVENPANGHAHLLYALQAPVPRTEAARAKPLQYLAAVQEGLRDKLRGDAGYSGHLCKNPLHPSWQTKQWADAYSLAELGDWVDLSLFALKKKRAANLDYAGLGRNCELFERLRPLSYRLVRKFWVPGGFEHFREALRAQAEDLNAGFKEPLPGAEIRALSASCARWVWGRFGPAAFRASQSRAGTRKGAKRRAEGVERAVWLATMGKTQREIATELEVSQKTISNWLKRPGILDLE